MRRTLALAAATSAALLAVSACTVGEPIGEQQGEGVTITFLTFETPNLTPEVWDASIQRALATNPGIRVEKLVAPTQDRTSYAQQLLTSGQFPDVMVAVSPGGFAEGGHLYAWQPDELEDFVCPDCGSIGGKVYQLPANTQAIPMVYFNETLFAQAGIAAPPTTYAELLAAAEKLKAAGVTPFVIGGEHDALGPTWAGILATEVFAKNPDWVTDRRAGTAKFTDPEFIAGATKLADLATRGYIDKGDLALDYGRGTAGVLGRQGRDVRHGQLVRCGGGQPGHEAVVPGRTVLLAVRRQQARRSRLHGRRAARQRRVAEPGGGEEVRALLPARQAEPRCVGEERRADPRDQGLLPTRRRRPGLPGGGAAVAGGRRQGCRGRGVRLHCR
jgi:hypothetical protein